MAPPTESTGEVEGSRVTETENFFNACDSSRKESHMKKVLILLVLAALGLGACADTNGSSRYRGSSSIIDLANTCATCGATVQDEYFAGSAFRAIGPGNY
jgi:hypothetical protein